MDTRLRAYSDLRQRLREKPFNISAALDLVVHLDLHPRDKKRCHALIHAFSRRERDALALLEGFLNRRESALLTALKDSTPLRQDGMALPKWMNGKLPSKSAKTIRLLPPKQ